MCAKYAVYTSTIIIVTYYYYTYNDLCILCEHKMEMRLSTRTRSFHPASCVYYIKYNATHTRTHRRRLNSYYAFKDVFVCVCVCVLQDEYLIEGFQSLDLIRSEGV